MFIILLLSVSVNAQEFNYVHYDTNEGLAGSTVYDACQDIDGFIWFATENGISRFDGTNYVNFTTKDGLPDNEVLKIFADSKGRVWISTFSNKMSYYLHGKIYNSFKDSILSQLKLNGPLTNIIESKNKGLFFCDKTQIFQLGIDNKVTKYSDILKIEKLHFKLENIEYNPCSDKLSVIDDTYSYIIENDSISKNKYKYYPRTSFNIDGFHLPTKEIKIETTITNITFKDCYIKYIATPDGAWSTDLQTNSLKTHYLAGNKITRVFEDNEKNIWFCTIGKGVFKLSLENARMAIFPNSEGNTEIFSIASHNGNIVCGAGQNTIYLIDKLNKTSVLNFKNSSLKLLKSNFPNRCVLIKSISSETLILGFDQFLAKIDNEKRFLIPIHTIKSIAKIDSNNIFVGTSNGAFKIRISDFKIVDTIWKLRCTKVQFYNNKFYIGTINGLFEIENKKINQNLAAPLNRRITDIIQATNNSLWIGTADAGLVKYKDGKILNIINETNGLNSNNCKSIFIDNNNLWVGTNNGLAKIDLSLPNHPIIKFGLEDGLPSNNINAVCVVDSLVYVGTPEGLTYFNYHQTSTNSICKLKLLNVVNNGKAFNLDSSILLSYKSSNIHFDFVAISFRSGGEIQYYYKLDGLDTTWKQTKSTSLDYPSLPSGNYELQLYAINKFGLKSETKTIPFTISTPYWKTWWFYLICVCAIIACTYYFVNRRNKKISKEIEEQHFIEKQFLGLEQQALQAQMNPHFIFNCLSSIQQYLVTNNKEKANIYLTNFGHLIRLTLENSAKPMLNLMEEINYLNKYLEMETMRFGDSFKYNIQVASNVDKENIEIPAMLLQPYVENALRHGIRNKPDKNGILLIDFSLENNQLVCHISDNGIGRKKSELNKNLQHITYQSKGMKLTQKRIELLNRMNDSKIKVDIVDLEDKLGNETGTEVILHF